MPLDGIHKRYDGDLTYLGRVIAALPVDVKVGKLLVLGHVFGFLKECLILGKYFVQDKKKQTIINGNNLNCFSLFKY